jgi:O-palmitoleoyl-L-serine hydrolase
MSQGTSNDWLVYLSGGGQCYDAESCSRRFCGEAFPHHDCRSSNTTAPCFMSSKDYPPTCGKTGIFDSRASKVGSLLAAATRVYVPYCSSDAWMGDKSYAHPARAPKVHRKFAAFEFRGHRIVDAVIADLQARGLGQGHANGKKQTLIFGGGSAGARGAMVHLDRVAAHLGSSVKRVVGFLDSPYYLDAASLDHTFLGFAEMMRRATRHFNISNLAEAGRCGAMYLPVHALWKCTMGVYRAPHVVSPHLIVSAQFDSWQLSHLVRGMDGIEHVRPPLVYSASEAAYALDYAAQTVANLTMLQTNRSSRMAIMSRACYEHHTSEHASFWADTTEHAQVTQSMALQAVLDGVAGNQWIDDCIGFNCSGMCG